MKSNFLFERWGSSNKKRSPAFGVWGLVVCLSVVMTSFSASPVLAISAPISFGEYEIHSNSFNTRDIEVGDMDGDGDLDIVEGNHGQKNYWYESMSDVEGGGISFNLAEPHEIHSNEFLTRAIALGDLDGDGDLDLVEGNENEDGVNGYWYKNDGDNSGNFIEATTFFTDNDSYVTSVQVGLINSDDDYLDIVVGSYGQNYWYKNDGTGSFAEYPISDAEFFTEKIKLVDLDKDGYLDVVEANFGQSNYWYKNDGAGNFTKNELYTNTNSSYALDVADLDGDGDLDIIEANNLEPDYWYENENMSFTPVFLDGNDFSFDIVVADFYDNGDSLLDILEGNNGQINEWLFQGVEGAFTSFGIASYPGNTRDIEVVDIDGDGDLDVLEGNEGQENYWYRINLEADFSADQVEGTTPLTVQFTNETKAASMTWEWDFDNDGVVDSVEQNPTYVYTNPGVFDVKYTVWDDYETDSITNVAYITVHAAPEINIKQGDAAIIDEVSNYDFGDVRLGSDLTVSFTVENLGVLDLILVGVQVNNDDDFTETLELVETIAPGESSDFEITFTPTSLGEHAANILVKSDDEDEGVYNFTMTGTGIAPEINIKQGDVDIIDGVGNYDFGNVNVGSSQIVSFTVENLGDADLILDGVQVNNDDDFTETLELVETIAPGESSDFEITFAPTSLGEHTANILVKSDDEDEGVYNFVITGTGTAVEDNGGNNPGGGSPGGGSGTPIIYTPQTVSLEILAETLDLDNNTVELQLSADRIPTQMAISLEESFADVSMIDYATSFVLSFGSDVTGELKVYAKFKNQYGTSAVVNDTIQIERGQVLGEQISACELDIKSAYKHPNSSAVYYITDQCTKRPFVSPAKFFSYFVNWTDVKLANEAVLDAIVDDTLGFMPWGPNYDPQYGALVKTVSDPKTYLLLGTEKYWITDETVFNALNYQWDWIEDVDQALLDKYETKVEIDYTDHHPNYTLIKYTDDAKVYRLEPDPEDEVKQIKRHIKDKASFKALGYRWDRIVVVADTEQYEDGEQLEYN